MTSDGIAGAFLAFAAMMKHDYGVNKKVALKALALAYDMDALTPLPEGRDTEQTWEAAYLAGFNRSGEGYNGEYPFGDNNKDPKADVQWHETMVQDFLQWERQRAPQQHSSKGDGYTKERQ